MRAGLVRSIVCVIALAGGGCESPSKEDAESRIPGGRLDLNRATVKELEALPGIGAVKARSIVASRNARGGRFATLEDLIAIDGVGEQTVARLREYVELR